ncbi:MAG TPA: peptidylprolyl isomerase [Polyangiaceae bacterium]|jgi:parvulin-like peptidyl-prolyl isomerase
MPTRLSALFLLLLLIAACSRKVATRDSDPAQGALVARVGKVEIHEADLQRAMAREPGGSPQRFESPNARRELVEGLVRFELLVQAAERAGLTRDPDAVHALQQIAVTKLVNRTLGEVGTPESITQADVEREYAARQASQYTLLEAVQLRHVLISDPKLAEQVAIQAKALSPTDDQAFAAIAASRSEDTATKASGGDLGFVDKNSRLPAAIIDAGLGLKASGDVAGPIRTDAGYEILRLVSRRAGAVSPLSSVQGQIRQRLYQERRAKALEGFIAQLRTETPVDLLDPH